MKKATSKVFFMVAAFVMIAVPLIGCQTAAPSAPPTSAVVNSPDTTTAPTTAPEAEEPNWKKDAGTPITIDWYVNETWYNVPEGNLASQLIKEKTGVTINWIVPVGSPDEKFNAMITANNLPDIVTAGWYAPQVPQIENDDYLYALSELADQYDPEFWKVTSPQTVNWYKADNGKLYMYPCNSNSPDDTEKYNVLSNRSFLVRKDIYEAIGSPDMRTPEGFLKALNDAKAKFPNADNGQPLIPFGATEFNTTGNTSFEDVLLEFLAQRDAEPFYDPKCGNENPEYIKWLKTFRQAYQDGNMPPDVFVDDRNKIEEKIGQGRYFALLYQWKDAMNPLGQIYKEKPEQIYIEVNGPSDTNLDKHRLGVSTYNGWEVTMITKNAKDPKRCIEFMTFGNSEEGQMTVYLGKEGVTYDMIDGKPIIKPEVNTMKNAENSKFKQLYNIYGEIWMFNSSMMNIWEPDPGMPLNIYREFNKGMSYHYGAYDNILPTANDPEYDALNKAQTKWGEVLPKLLMAASDAEFDQLWNEYKTYKDSIGYQKVLDYERSHLEANKTKLGIK